MGLRFRKSKKVAPGVRLNFSKSGMSVSLGPRGNTVTISKKGVYHNMSMPGTGVSYRQKLDVNPKAKQITVVTRRCFNCGNLVGSDVSFCGECGHPLSM